MEHLRVDPGGFQIPGMHRPSLTNQPPQIFGPYLHDGLPAYPGDLSLGYDPSALFGDDIEAKRRRIAKVSIGLMGGAGCAGCAGCAGSSDGLLTVVGLRYV